MLSGWSHGVHSFCHDLHVLLDLLALDRCGDGGCHGRRNGFHFRRGRCCGDLFPLLLFKKALDDKGEGDRDATEAAEYADYHRRSVAHEEAPETGRIALTNPELSAYLLFEAGANLLLEFDAQAIFI